MAAFVRRAWLLRVDLRPSASRPLAAKTGPSRVRREFPLYRSFGVSCYDKYLEVIPTELATSQLSQIIKKKLTAGAKGGMR